MSSRLLLLPEEVYENLAQQGNILMDPVDKSLVKTSNELSNILHNPSLSNEQKYLMYDQRLKRQKQLLADKDEKLSKVQLSSLGPEVLQKLAEITQQNSSGTLAHTVAPKKQPAARPKNREQSDSEEGTVAGEEQSTSSVGISRRSKIPRFFQQPKTSDGRRKEKEESEKAGKAAYAQQLLEHSTANDNDGNNYMLVCVDLMSRKMYAEPVKQKSSTYMIPAFEKIFKRAGTYPWSLYTDAGVEFTSRAMVGYFKKYEIEKRTAVSHPVLHATVAERAIRTIKERLYKYFNEKNTVRWVSIIQKIVNAINHSVNRSIGVRPVDVTYQNADELYDRVFKEEENNKKAKYKIGDIVRIDQEKKTFTKGYLPKYSAELFKITEVFAHKNPIVYKICDLNDEPIKGYFYEQELVKSDIKSNWTVEKVLNTRKKGRKTEAYVKWKGFPSSYNRWISQDDLI
ncbi:integrase core domain-containing protein [Ditylenchus destructor]|nr:integrase core domain-containing protein [Ditylenchus destructor]